MIKVTKKEDAAKGITGFIFECNSPDDYEALDKLRVAILGDIPKRGYYDNSNTMIIEAKIPEVTLPEAKS